jgi:hypothetical protein
MDYGRCMITSVVRGLHGVSCGLLEGVVEKFHYPYSIVMGHTSNAESAEMNIPFRVRVEYWE